MERKNFHQTLTCAHCGNISNMVEIGHFKQHDLGYDTEGHGGYYEISSYNKYFGLLCPKCDNVNIVKYYIHEDMDSDDIEYEFLYPQNSNYPKGLPPRIMQAFINAEKIKLIDVHAYAAVVRRLLEQVCLENGAKKGTLHLMLADLASKGEIPPKLVDVATAIRSFGNIGAHASDEELSVNEIPIVNDLCIAVLEYIYSAPQLVMDAENTLNRIKNKVKKTP